MYGKEIILDLHYCNSSKFTRKYLRKYMIKICELIDMERHDLYFWDYKGQEEEYNKAPNHLKGTSAVQFITTSNITIHTLDVLQKVFINLFSCKDFDDSLVEKFSASFFEGKVVSSNTIKRL